MRYKWMAVITAWMLAFGTVVCAQDGDAEKDEKKQAPAQPPAVVSVAEITKGASEPVAEFIGTVYFARVSDVASEIEGRVEAVNFEEGRRVKAGENLVALNADLLNAAMKGTRARIEQVQVQIQKAKKDFSRVENLYKEKSIAESVYDDNLFKIRELEKQAAALQADFEKQRIEKEKKTIRAPFDGVVIDKSVEEGEWVGAGSVVAVIGQDDAADVIINVPERILEFMEPGRAVSVKTRAGEYSGRFTAFIPRGDVSTRTFAIKIRLENQGGLIEGMEAAALLPAGPKIEGFLVSRDAVISKFGQNVIFLAADGKAKMVPVKVTGYQGLMAGVEGPGLAEGLQAVVKGNERIRDGQPLQIIGQ